MNELIEERMVLSRMELYLCMQISGCTDYNDFPMSEGNVPLEKRMLDAFLHLTELGILIPHGTQYALSTSCREKLAPVAFPDWKCVLLRRSGRHVLYGKSGTVLLAETDSSRSGSCAILPMETDAAFSALLSRIPIVAQTDQTAAVPQEPFDGDSTAEELLASSEAVLLFSHADAEEVHRARVFIQDMTPWFSVLRKDSAPTPYCVSEAEKWLRRMKERTI